MTVQILLFTNQSTSYIGHKPKPYNNKHLMTAPNDNSEFRSLQAQSLSVLLYLPTQK